jgi:hypothetical protein
MNQVERFSAVTSFRSPDRMPMIEWAGWWDKTVARWRGEGLPPTVAGGPEIREYLGLDSYRQLWIHPHGRGCPSPPKHGAGNIANMDDYERILPYLYPQPSFNAAHCRGWGDAHRRGEMVVWISLDGFFWFARGLLGIEPHLYAFHDQPELMHRINSDLAAFNLRAIAEFREEVCVPDFMTFGEDMSYNHGPMLSKLLFDTFLAPYYRKVVPVLKEQGTTAMVDSDGDVTTLIPWLEEVGVEGLLPLERRSGVDVGVIRQRHPHFCMIGAFDKMVMKEGEGAMRREFERLLPVLRTGGFIASVDHQTPPDVSLETYRTYLALLREYSIRTAR